MDQAKVDAIVKALSELDNDEYVAVAKEINKGLTERGIVKPKSHPLSRRISLKF